VEGGHGVVGVVLTGQEGGQLQPVDVRFQAVQRRDELTFGVRVGGLVQKLIKDLGLLDALGELVVALDVRANLR
jgi:hypothetical protein